MISSTDEVLALLIERVESHYYGKYRGTVTNNKDPDNLGRVKARVPRVLGEHEETGWALPAFIYGGAGEQGFFAVPDVGAGVWIEFEGGDLSYPIWSGTWFTQGSIPESAKPGKKVLKTKAGHKIVFDDDAGRLEVTDSNGNTITMDSQSIRISAGKAGNVVIDAPKIELVQNASHPVVLGDELNRYLNLIVKTFQTHTHPGEMAGAGAAALPVTPMPPTPSMPAPSSSLLSSKVSTG